MTDREEALAKCLRAEQVRCDELRREVFYLEDANRNLRVELEAADAIVAEAMVLLGVSSRAPGGGRHQE